MANVKKTNSNKIPLSWIRFGNALFDNGGNATEAYRTAFPKSKKWTAENVAVHAFHLKRKLQETDWFKEVLDRTGLTQERLSAKLEELINANETKFFSKDGVVIEERVVPDYKTRTAAVKLALEAQKLLVQRQEVKAEVSATPKTITDWLKYGNRTESEPTDETGGDGDETEE